MYRGQDNVAIAHNTWIENAKGGDGDDTITGNNKGNEITGNGGDDAIDGGGGVDAAIYSEAYANYSLSNSGTSVTISHTGGAANEGTDTLTNIEYIKFSDGYYDVASSAFNSGVALPGLSGTETGGQTGGVSYGAGSANLSGMSLKDISLATQLDSKGAITILNKTLEEISAARSTLGAVMNRMQHSIASQSEASMMSQQSRGRVVSRFGD